jgi:hypothetical protein
LEGEIQPKNQLSYKSKVPLLIDRFERHSKELPTASCAPVIVFELWRRTGRRDTAEKRTELKEQSAVAY